MNPIISDDHFIRIPNVPVRLPSNYRAPTFPVALVPQYRIEDHPIVPLREDIDPTLGVAGTGGGGGVTAFPFDVTFAPLGAGTQTASVRPGSVNGLLPSNYTDTYAQTIATTYFLVLSVTVVAGAVTACSLSFPTSPPSGMPVTNGAPPTAFDVLLGVVLGGVWYRAIGNGSVAATSAEAYKVSKTSPAPGTLPYDIWYTWALGSF